MPEVISPEGRLDLASIADFHRCLLATAGQDVTIDLSRCTFFGALALQCCVSAIKTAQKQGKSVEFAPLPEAVCTQLAHIGLSEADLQRCANGH